MEKYDFENDEVLKEQDPVMSQEQSSEELQPEDEFDDMEPKKRMAFQPIYIGYIAGFLVMLIGVYMLFFADAPGKPNAPAPKTTSQNASVAAKLNPVTTPSKPLAINQSQNIPLNSKVSKQILAQMADMQEALQHDSSVINKLQQQQLSMLDRQKTIYQAFINFSSELKNIDTSIQQVKGNLVQLSDLKVQLKRVTNALDALQVQKFNEADKLALNAIVDGKAWLQDSKGHTIVVSVGDDIDHYGEVEKIDAKTYKVYMSSGMIFK
ncbi:MULTISPECIES: hypothetical protein [Cysteiniphilum]|uniref:hypothetical protein n=1 Tax=Cysteiniphilum TaxID=2056696 RepID=UPI001781C4E8|nr:MULTISPECIES: hypothetical protein [Cysteiniphilum]